MTAHCPIPKAEPVRSEPYRRAVAALPCWLCDVHLHSQAAHADESKGAMLKSCDLTCFPLCAPNRGLPGCHYTVGSSGTFTRAERRELEHQASAETQATLIRHSTHDPRLRRVLQTVGLLP